MELFRMMVRNSLSSQLSTSMQFNAESRMSCDHPYGSLDLITCYDISVGVIGFYWLDI
jgi:hypothetical protein